MCAGVSERAREEWLGAIEREGRVIAGSEYSFSSVTTSMYLLTEYCSIMELSTERVL